MDASFNRRYGVFFAVTIDILVYLRYNGAMNFKVRVAGSSESTILPPGRHVVDGIPLVLPKDGHRPRQYKNWRQKLAPGNVRKLRVAAGLSRRQLAARMGVSNKTVARWETPVGAPGHRPLAGVNAFKFVAISCGDEVLQMAETLKR